MGKFRGQLARLGSHHQVQQPERRIPRLTNKRLLDRFLVGEMTGRFPDRSAGMRERLRLGGRARLALGEKGSGNTHGEPRSSDSHFIPQNLKHRPQTAGDAAWLRGAS